jgi:hypothetical protein
MTHMSHFQIHRRTYEGRIVHFIIKLGRLELKIIRVLLHFLNFF